MKQQPKQMAIIVYSYTKGVNIEASNIGGLNQYLEEGWNIVSSSPMGVAGGGETFAFYAASLVVLEKPETKKD